MDIGMEAAVVGLRVVEGALGVIEGRFDGDNGGALEHGRIVVRDGLRFWNHAVGFLLQLKAIKAGDVSEARGLDVFDNLHLVFVKSVRIWNHMAHIQDEGRRVFIQYVEALEGAGESFLLPIYVS
jgi:hypothetical protein